MSHPAGHQSMHRVVFKILKSVFAPTSLAPPWTHGPVVLPRPTTREEGLFDYLTQIQMSWVSSVSDRGGGVHPESP